MVDIAATTSAMFNFFGSRSGGLPMSMQQPVRDARKSDIPGSGEEEDDDDNTDHMTRPWLHMLLERLQDFSVRKCLPDYVFLNYQIQQHPPAVAGKPHVPLDRNAPVNQRDKSYITDMLLEENVKYVFDRHGMMDLVAVTALEKLVTRIDASTHTKDEADAFKANLDSSNIITPTEVMKLNRLYPHLLGLIDALLLYVRNHENLKLEPTSSPDRLEYEMWSATMTDVIELWKILYHAHKTEMLKLDYTEVTNVDKRIDLMMAQQKIIATDIAKAEDDIAEILKVKRDVERQVREIQAQSLGIEHRLNVKTGHLNTMRARLESECDEKGRAMHNLEKLAYSLQRVEPLLKACGDQAKATVVFERVKAAHAVSKKQEQHVAA